MKTFRHHIFRKSVDSHVEVQNVPQWNRSHTSLVPQLREATVEVAPISPPERSSQTGNIHEESWKQCGTNHTLLQHYLSLPQRDRLRGTCKFCHLHSASDRMRAGTCRPLYSTWCHLHGTCSGDLKRDTCTCGRVRSTVPNERIRYSGTCCHLHGACHCSLTWLQHMLPRTQHRAQRTNTLVSHTQLQ